MKFDTFLATVGDWGRFQKVKYTLICLTYMLPPIMVYTYTFTAATPNFRCINPTGIQTDDYSLSSNQLFDSHHQPTKEQCNQTVKKLSLTECQRCYIRKENSSNGKIEKCSTYVYERKDYTKTLVEEVRLLKTKFLLLLKHFILSGQWFAIVLLIDQQYK
jgi:hypothetical protein